MFLLLLDITTVEIVTRVVVDPSPQLESENGFKGDLRLWIKLLLPQAVKRVYNLQSKQLVKLFSRILRQNQDDMLEDLEQGDVAETVSKFFQESKHCRPSKNSHLTIQEIDKFLEELSQLTREDDQAHLFTQICEKCTSNDLCYIIRLVKHDLRINAGPKHILEAIHPEAYLAFQTSRDLDTVLEEVFSTKSKEEKGSPKSLNISVKLMTPVLPMLAEACKSIEQALKKCPNGMFSEIKYDGERVQVHKSGSEFKYFSRSLKPVMPHKVKEFKDYIPEAFPGGEDLILDSEILMIDTKTGQPLPFGTLGIHKKGEYKDACVCLFVFDCIYYNGKSLLHLPIKKRRKILLENMTEIKNRVVFSEAQEVNSAKDLENMMTKVFQMGLEGLVLKDFESQYEPGKRHWLKVKKDYLFGGAMADTADLVVLGAWFGTGQKGKLILFLVFIFLAFFSLSVNFSGGMMSVFLMGCWDPAHKVWCTVTKVHTGHDDKTLEQLQGELEMEKISKEVNRVPSWLKCTKTMVPDFVAKNPKNMPVWEITGAEFTQHEVHTAAGISIRFPRVTRIRSDKSWDTATSLPELKELFKKSKDSSDFCLPSHFLADDDRSESESPKKKESRKIKRKDDNDEDDDDDETCHDNQQNISQKRKTERECSPKHKSRRDDSPKQTQSRDHSPKRKHSKDDSVKSSSRDHSPKRKLKKDDSQKQKSSRDSSTSRERVDSPKRKKNSSPSSEIDANSEESENSRVGKEKQLKRSEELRNSKKKNEALLQDEEIEDEEEESESYHKELQKKRKKADSSSDQPIKKVKLDDSSGLLQINARDEIKKDSKLIFQQEGSSHLSNHEAFVRSLISEIQLITNPVLYHRVKKQLFDTVHKAQEEQMELDSSHCLCKCVRCDSFKNEKEIPSTDSVQSLEKAAVHVKSTSETEVDICTSPTQKESISAIQSEENLRDDDLENGKQTKELSTSLLEDNNQNLVSASPSSTLLNSPPNSPKVSEGNSLNSVENKNKETTIDSDSECNPVTSLEENNSEHSPAESQLKNDNHPSKPTVSVNSDKEPNSKNSPTQNDNESTTHAVHLTNSLSQDKAYRWPRTARHIEIDWLIDSLKLQKLQRTQPYAVTVCPSTN
ncbi:DNA ligase [Gryllus bimaculatus]|nr:DNA ligase [Gryllus bimaculatus]